MKLDTVMRWLYFGVLQDEKSIKLLLAKWKVIYSRYKSYKYTFIYTYDSKLSDAIKFIEQYKYDI